MFRQISPSPFADAAVAAAAAVLCGGTSPGTLPLSLRGPDMPVPLSYAAANGLFDLPWDSIRRSNSVGEAAKEYNTDLGGK